MISILATESSRQPFQDSQLKKFHHLNPTNINPYINSDSTSPNVTITKRRSMISQLIPLSTTMLHNETAANIQKTTLSSTILREVTRQPVDREWYSAEKKRCHLGICVSSVFIH